MCEWYALIIFRVQDLEYHGKILQNYCYACDYYFFFLKNTSKLQTASSLIRISYNNLCFSKNSSVFCKEINNIQERCATVIMNTKFFSLSVSQFNNSFENFQGYCTEQMFTLQMRETLLQRYVNVIMNTSNQNQLDCIAFVL